MISIMSAVVSNSKLEKIVFEDEKSFAVKQAHNDQDDMCGHFETGRAESVITNCLY